MNFRVEHFHLESHFLFHSPSFEQFSSSEPCPAGPAQPRGSAFGAVAASPFTEPTEIRLFLQALSHTDLTVQHYFFLKKAISSSPD